MKYVKIITVALLTIIFIAMRSACSSDKEISKPLTVAEKQQKVKDSLKTIREDKLDKALTVLKMKIKENMKDPSSFEMVKRSWNPADSIKDVVGLQIQFRGNNSFGGKALNIAQGKYNFKTDVVEIVNITPL